MSVRDGNSMEDEQGTWVSSEDVARYAEADLDRWRQLIGYRVQHHDARWGVGVIEAILWGSPCDHVPDYVQVRIRYEAGWTVMAHSATWQQHHQQASVPAHIEAVIRECLDEALSEDEQADCLAKHSHEMREQQDRQTLERRKKRQQASVIRESEN